MSDRWKAGGAGRRGDPGAGRGTAVELGAAGATVYVTGRSTRAHRPSTTARRPSRTPPTSSPRPAARASPYPSTTWTSRRYGSW